ncbi:hypothetical protein [Microbacterium album]|uniref:Pectate lyase superfamily protein domain-containing protein n=1 Tax=Microbacterium album TaxID=2053191 RepID=A0A917MK32_9MICO|nr:hypothetical protein [Microbacterium album]GGH34297.1 hypothetical protein GCM10010921_01890 [Microbacterium album]
MTYVPVGIDEDNNLPPAARQALAQSDELSNTFVELDGLTLDARRFGVAADGVADDTAALRACSAAASSAAVAASRPVTILLPAGPMRVTGAIGTLASNGRYEIPSRVRWIGRGRGVTEFRPEGSGYSLFTRKGGASAPLLGVEFAHFDIRGDGYTQPGAYNPEFGKGIFGQYFLGAWFHDLGIFNTLATGLGVDFLAGGSIIERVWAEGCGRGYTGNFEGNIGASGIGIGTRGSWTAREDLVVRDCIAINNKNNGLFDEDQFMPNKAPAFGTRYVNCLAIGNRIGFASKESNSRFIACEAYGNSQWGAAVGDAARFEGGSYSRNGDPADAVSYGDGIVVRRHEGDLYGEPTFSGSVLVEGNARSGLRYEFRSATAKMSPLSGIVARRNGQSGVLFVASPTSLAMPRVYLGSIVTEDNGQFLVSNRRAGVTFTGTASIAEIHALGGTYRDTGGGTQERAIHVVGSSVAVGGGEVQGNVISGHTLQAIRFENTASEANVLVRGNDGLRSEARGVATIPDGNMTVTVAHGLFKTPTDIVATPRGTATPLAVDTVNANTFRVTRSPLTAGALDVNWRAAV